MVDLNLVSDYINGEDLNCDVEVLENNPDFMLEVLRLSMDTKMYELCSDTVKNNFNFVVGIINLFSDDNFEFVKRASKKYLESLKPPENMFKVTSEEAEDRIHAFEVNILVSGLKSETNIFRMNVISTCLRDETRIEAFRKYCNDPEIREKIGIGFLLIIDRYGTSSIIQDFYAKKFLNKIFYYDSSFLEKSIHRRYHNPSGVLEAGINSTIIDIVRENDIMLSDYIMTHPELLAGLRQDISHVVDNWDRYMERVNKFRVDAFENEISKFIDSDDNFSYVNVDGLVTYTVCRTDHEEEFIKYDSMYKKDADTTQFFMTKDFNTLRAIRFASHLMNDLFKSDVVSDIVDDYVDRESEGKEQAIIYDISSK